MCLSTQMHLNAFRDMEARAQNCLVEPLFLPNRCFCIQLAAGSTELLVKDSWKVLCVGPVQLGGLIFTGSRADSTDFQNGKNIFLACFVANLSGCFARICLQEAIGIRTQKQKYPLLINSVTRVFTSKVYFRCKICLF